ncbi:Pentatricopeptide repeat-containing protein [Diplonema papillatum]|nr:Pentatricopeptide repeat-containing protein [Diplonema papillatum]
MEPLARPAAAAWRLAACARQRRHVQEFRVDPRFVKGRGFLHYAFKTKAQIDKEEKKKRAEEWNEWDIESLVRYRSIRNFNRGRKQDAVEAKQELRMSLRLYASDTFRGGMPRPMELRIMKELQNTPARFIFHDHVVGGGDYTNLDMGLVLKYVEPNTIPPPLELLDKMLEANHVFDDVSSGHFITHCRRLIASVKTFGFGGDVETYDQVKQCWDIMKQREGGHRCTLKQFAYSQMIKICADMQDIDRAFALKAELVERHVPLNASVYEGLLQAAVDVGRPNVAWLEWREMQDRHRLGPTVECSKQLIKACITWKDFKAGEEVWKQMTEDLLLEPDLAAYNEMIKLCATCGESERAFYYYFSILEHTALKPDLTTCNILLEAADSLPQAETVMEYVNTRLLEQNDATFLFLFKLSGRKGDLSALTKYWDMMQDKRSRPSVECLHAYIEALLEMPQNDAEYHPTELLGRAVAAYDWAGRSAVFNEGTFLLLMQLCARCGQLPMAKLLVKKMVHTDIRLGPPHAAAFIATVATSDCAMPLAEVEGMLNILEPTFASDPAARHAATTVLSFYFVLTKRSQDLLTYDSNATDRSLHERIAAVWNSIEARLGEGDAEAVESRQLLAEVRKEVQAIES